jgi:hypothetical protein
MYGGTQQILAALSAQWQVSPPGDVTSASSSRLPSLRGGRATTDACLNRRYAACACSTKPRRGPPAALPEAGVWWRAWGDGAHCPCAARHAAIRFNDHIYASRKFLIHGRVKARRDAPPGSR